MSELRDILSDSIDERLAYTGEVFTHVRTGRTFIAEYQEAENIELLSELGRDPREAATMHVQDRVAAAWILVGDRVQCVFYGVLNTFEVTKKRTDNPGSSQVEFGLRKLVKE